MAKTESKGSSISRQFRTLTNLGEKEKVLKQSDAEAAKVAKEAEKVQEELENKEEVAQAEPTDLEKKVAAENVADKKPAKKTAAKKTAAKKTTGKKG